MRYIGVIVSALLTLALATVSSSRAAVEFSTDSGTGPDKWASVWLLTRFVDHTTIRVEPAGTPAFPGTIVFDKPGAALARTGSRTTYATIIEAYGVDDPVATALGTLVHEIEIDAWRTQVSLEARIVETAFRTMQLSFGREDVTRTCYLRLFDRIASRIDAELLNERSDPKELVPDESCLGKSSAVSSSPLSVVPEVDLSDLLVHIALGARVLFVDTRELWEYEEGHIPGAINLQLRDLSSGRVQDFPEADLVIAYCVKDFRGYEVAKRFRSLGIDAAIMRPYGMRGWIQAGLPVAGSRGLPVDEARAAMRALARAAAESS